MGARGCAWVRVYACACECARITMAEEESIDAFSCEECRALELLYTYWFRNVHIDIRLQAAPAGSDDHVALAGVTMGPRQVQFLHDAIDALRAYMLRDRALEYVTPIGRPEPAVFDKSWKLNNFELQE